MPIRIEVTACNGTPLSESLGADFDELGGSIGRGEDCVLVLPDPQRFISRNHASIAFRAGGYAIVDKGKSLPVEVNGRPLGHGIEAPIADGDEIVIGAYRLRVHALAQTPQAVVETAPAGEARDDPLALFGAGESKRPAAPSVFDDPFARPAPREDDARATDSVLASSTDESTSPARLPDDVDFGLGLPPVGGNIDEAFGLPPHGNADLFPPGSPLAAPATSGAAGASIDPLAAFGVAAPPAPAAPQRDNTPELQGAYRPPKAIPDAALAVSPGPLNRSQAPPVASRPLVEGEILDPLVAFGGPSPTPGPAPASPAAASRPVGTAVPQDLLLAFLDGAGVPDLQIPGGVTPETMALLGRVFREALQGTLDLLLARATIKREVRADMTMIVGRENNPLKFSPNVEAALAHLLAPQAPGFMSPLEAMKDAYDDLRSHQFGFMAGMRAALAAILQRFDPATLEHRLTQKSVMDSVLPMNRRAKLWDLFESLYAEISKEAEDDFHTLFGREFVRAYEAQIAKLGNGDEMDRR